MFVVVIALHVLYITSGAPINVTQKSYQQEHLLSLATRYEHHPVGPRNIEIVTQMEAVISVLLDEVKGNIDLLKCVDNNNTPLIHKIAGMLSTDIFRRCHYYCLMII